jgi:murein DD-endopeptidase MepM/ murein hydrolase activator NlpD
MRSYEINNSCFPYYLSTSGLRDGDLRDGSPTGVTWANSSKNNRNVVIGKLTVIQSVFVFLTAFIVAFDSVDGTVSTSTVDLSQHKDIVLPSLSVLSRQIQPEVRSPTFERAQAISFVRHKVARGATLETILRDYDVAEEHAHILARSYFDGPKQGRFLKAGENIELVYSALVKQIVGLKKDTRDGGYMLLSYLPDQGLIKESVEGQVTEEERIVTGTIQSSFAKSAGDLSLPYGVVDDFVDLFANNVEFRKDLHPGDSFSIIYTDKRDQRGNVLEAGPIVAASLRTRGRTVVSVRHVGLDGKARYFDQNGETSGDSFLRYPLKFTRISSIFSKSRFHPVLKSSKPHNGVDFAAPTGTPVRSIGDGVVTYAGWKGPNGILVKVQHSDQYSSAYVHLSKLAPGIKQGMRVQRGQQVGAVGQTGRATGPHLHFSLYRNERFIDPLTTDLPMVVDKRNMIPKSLLMARVGTLREQLDTVAVAKAMSADEEDVG